MPLMATQASTAPHVDAEGAILMDAKTGKILYEKNATTRYYPASITKLMTALLVIENLKPTNTITFSQDAIYGIESGSSSIGMRIGEQITVDQALHGLLLMSANEIANGLAEAVSGSTDAFSTFMTRRAQELGATNTNFMNPHGLHDENHYTTAYDMALIMRELYNNEYFLEIMSHPTYQIPPTNKSSEARPLSQEHGLMNERRNSALYRSDVIGGKTGYTDQARNTLVTASRQGDIDLIVVILKGSKSTMYDDTNRLLDYGFNSYHTLELHSTSSVLTNLPVYSLQSGELLQSAQVDISVASNESLLISRDIKLRDITTKLNLPEYLSLGVKEQEKIGTIDYIYANQIVATNDLIIAKLHYNSSPFSATNPQQTTLSFPFEWLLAVGGGLLGLLIVITLLRNRRRRKVFQSKRYKKLRFDKMIR